MRRLALAMATASLAACSTAPSTTNGAVAEQQLQALLAGKVAGRPVECLSQHESNAASLIAPHAIAFQVNPARVYVSDVSGTGCEGLSDPTYSLQSTSHGPGGLCRGEIVQVRDLRTGIMMGSCAIGAFTPYVRPGA